jgi:hypothetical protein
MPEYRFKNKTTNKVWNEWMTISQCDEFVKDPNIEQMVFGSPRIVRGVGSPKTAASFKEKLKQIKKANRGSTINTG